MPTDLPDAPLQPAAEPKLFGLDGRRTATNEKGIVLPYLCGTRKVALKWMSPPYNYRTTNIQQKVGKEKKTVAKDVYCSIAGAVCLGPIDRIEKIYYGGEAIWSTGYTFGAGQHVHGVQTSKGTFYVYRGTDTQPADAYVLGGQSVAWPTYERSAFNGWFGGQLAKIRQVLPGAGTLDTICRDEHPRYPGVCYLVCKDLYCGRNSQAVPNIEVAVGRSPVVPDWINVDRTRRTNGCNPVAIILELLTRLEMGVGLSQGEVEVGELEALGAAMEADSARYYLSPLLEAQQGASKAIEELLTHIDGFQASREGRFSLGYFPKDGQEPSVRTLSIHEMTEQPTMTLPDWSKTANRIVVKVPSRDLDFEEDSVDRKSSYNLRVQGRIVTKSLEADSIIDNAQALRFAGEQVEIAASPEDSGRITVLAHKAVNLDGAPMLPGHRFRLNYEPWALDMVCRITGVSQKSVGALEVSFVRERGLFAQPYAAPADPVIVDEQVAEIGITRARVFELTEELAGASGVWVGVLAEQPAPQAGGYVVWYSAAPEAGESRTFDQIGSSEFWAASGSLAESVEPEDVVVFVTFPGSLGDFDTESTQAQANDTLLLLVGDELMSVGHWEAVPERPGVYRFEILRGRSGTTASTHADSEEAWLFYREQLVRLTHNSFASDNAPQFKLQTVAVGGVQPLDEAFTVTGFTFRDRSGDSATAWITASDLNFTTTYNSSGVATTSPSSITLTCHTEAIAAPTFQWQRYASGAWANVAGTGATLSIAPGEEGRYRCIVSAAGIHIETAPLDINRITEAPGGTTPLACGGIIVNGLQVVGPRLPGIPFNLDVTIPGVDGTESNAASKAAVEQVLGQLRDTVQSILDRLGSTNGHGLTE